jgi:hypothetical protein
MEGKFDLKYFLMGAGKEDWFKAWGNGWRLLVTIVVAVLLVGGVIFFISRGRQTQNTEIKEVKGDVNIIQKSSRFLIPFVEIYTMKERNYDGFGYGMKAGIRLEF